ncbi:MAG: hypothetical protein CSB48_01700 [Proteobacteria bacterium]|nr:MAG: hypothetical protein CSB48_01700 [Pseudomonadota bacterium]PIE40231.1 MAG: hypothetical protein CSA51_01755 [Gammaproteobacteria bacterium]
MSVTRRKFIQAIAVAAGAATLPVLSGCNDYDEKYAAKPPKRDSAFFPQSVMSGDPRSDSVILWTRVEDEAASGDVSVTLQVSTKENFSAVIVETSLDALAINDHCLKVRVTSLSPYTTYYYRFIYNNEMSPTGRTKTAAAADDDRKVKYAFVSCQDYIGRYYNAYLRLLEEDMSDVDFVVHLGDYIYETAGDPSFQDASDERAIVFEDVDGAVPVRSPDGSVFYGAQSVDNYRQLYKTYRSDPVLRKVHEKFPLVAIWDDHEFSDDSWQNNATYHGVTTGEGSLIRKTNSEQVYFEYMPIDQDSVAGSTLGTEGRIDVDTGKLSQGNVAENGVGSLSQGVPIYRNLRFGKNLELFLTDFRTHRPDHLIPEDAFPGSVIAPVGPAANPALSHFSVDDLTPVARGALTQILTGMYIRFYETLGQSVEDTSVNAASKAAELSGGTLSTGYIFAVIDGAVAAGQLDEQTGGAIKADITANLQPTDALSYYSLGKTALYGDLGSRYFVVKSAYDALTNSIVPGSAQNAFGEDQFAWLQSGLSGSDATWRVLGSSVSLTPMVLGLDSVLPDSVKSRLPASLQNDFYLNVDQWDGFQKFRDGELLSALRATDRSENGVLAIAGDIHSTWVSDHADGRMCFTTSSVSSATFHELLETQAAGLVKAVAAADPALGAEDLQGNVDSLLSMADHIMQESDARVKLGRTGEHGIGVMEVDSKGANVTFYQLMPHSAGLDMIKTSYYDSPRVVLDRMFERKFRVESNTLVQLGQF